MIRRYWNLPGVKNLQTPFPIKKLDNVYSLIYIKFDPIGLGWRPGGFRGLQIRTRGTDTILGEFDSHTGP